MKLLSVACIAACAIGSPKQPHDITAIDVDHAIQRIKTELLDRFDEERGWEPEVNHTNWLSKGLGGSTAIATLALLSANESQHSRILKTALQHIESVKTPSTYVCSLKIMIYSKLSPRFDKQLKLNVRRIVESMNRSGSWGYNSEPPISTETASPIIRRFASVALLEAHRKGIRIPSACFGAIATTLIQTQHVDGGWSHAQEETAPNATVAGFNCLLGADEVLGESLSKTNRQIMQRSLQQSLDWLNKNYTPKNNTGGTAMTTYLCGLERAAMSCGLDQLRESDWYRNGVAAILKAHCASKNTVKGSTVNLSFALQFLTQGRVPLALVELRAIKTSLDPIRLSRKIATSVSNQIEQTLSWRVITTDDNVHRWLQAPLLLVQDPDALPENQDVMREYLDLGGLLLLFGDKNNAQLFTTYASEICPQSVHNATRKKHWSLNLIQNAEGIQIDSWNDGVRDRIILVRQDPQKYSSKKQTQLTKAVVNICCGAAELSKWRTRLSQQQIELDRDAIVLAMHEGHWDVEQLGLRKIGMTSKPLNQLSPSQIAIVGGINADDATDKLASDVISFAKDGGFVIIEPIGGLSDFVPSMRTNIGKRLSTSIEPDSTLVRKMQPVGFRGWTLRNNTVVTSPLVARVGSGQIIFLDGDIRTALLGQPMWGIHGYDTQTSIALLDAVCERVSGAH